MKNSVACEKLKNADRLDLLLADIRGEIKYTILPKKKPCKSILNYTR